MASVLGKLKTNLCYLRDENHAMDSYAILWRTAKCLPVRKIFLVLLSTVVSKIQFICAGCYFTKTNASPNFKDQYLPKKLSRTKDLFVFWTFKGTSLDLTCFYRNPGR